MFLFPMLFIEANFFFFFFFAVLVSRGYENSRMLRKQLMEHERTLELETRRLSGMQLMAKPVNDQSYFGYSMDELNTSEGLLLTYCLVFLLHLFPTVILILISSYLLQVISICHPQNSFLVCLMC